MWSRFTVSGGGFLLSLRGPGAAGLSRQLRVSERIDVKVLLRSQSNFISAASVLGQIQRADRSAMQMEAEVSRSDFDVGRKSADPIRRAGAAAVRVVCACARLLMSPSVVI